MGYDGTTKYYKTLGANLTEEEIVKEISVNLNVLTASPHTVLDL